MNQEHAMDNSSTIRSSVLRRTFAALGLLVISMAVTACDQYSTQDAYDECNKIAKGSALSDDEFAACVACFENCGSACGEQADGGGRDFACE